MAGSIVGEEDQACGDDRRPREGEKARVENEERSSADEQKDLHDWHAVPGVDQGGLAHDTALVTGHTLGLTRRM